MRSARLITLIIVTFCSVLVAQTNPIPFVDQPLLPDSAEPGGPGFTLAVRGGGFGPGSLVNWNGKPLATTFISGTSLRAAVPASAIARRGTASITIANPSAGSGVSSAVFFPVRQPVRTVHFGETVATAAAGNMVVADFNGDGKLDVASDSSGLKGVQVALGNGDGTFQSSTFNAGCYGAAIAAGDFNGDGFTDLAEACGYEVDVFLGNGNGSFQTGAGTVTQTYNVYTLTAADFNRDGKMDLALVGVDINNVATVTILSGNGDGTFQPPFYVSLGGNVSIEPFVATGDFNNDGRLDLAVISGGNSGVNVFILLGNGNGTFQVLPPIVQSLYATHLAVADFNGDGKLDLALSSQLSDVFVLLGKGDGTFAHPVRSRAPQTRGVGIGIADFNGDQTLDIAVVTVGTGGTTAISILRGNGDGTFQPALNSKGSLYYGGSLAVGDFNGDGELDLLLASSPDTPGFGVYLQPPPH